MPVNKQIKELLQNQPIDITHQINDKNYKQINNDKHSKQMKTKWNKERIN